MRIFDIEQGTEEWNRLRAGVFTASNFSKIITSKGDPSTSQNDEVLKVVAEYFMGRKASGYVNAAMERGIELEEEAAIFYQERTFNIVEKCGFMLSDCGHIGCSPDRLIGENGLLEIKCPEEKAHMRYLLDGAIPSQYYAQVQGQLMVSERGWSDFVSYNPSFPEDMKMLIVRAQRDEPFILRLCAELDKCIEKKLRLIEKAQKGIAA